MKTLHERSRHGALESYNRRRAVGKSPGHRKWERIGTKERWDRRGARVWERTTPGRVTLWIQRSRAGSVGHARLPRRPTTRGRENHSATGEFLVVGAPFLAESIQTRSLERVEEVEGSLQRMVTDLSRGV